MKTQTSLALSLLFALVLLLAATTEAMWNKNNNAVKVNTVSTIDSGNVGRTIEFLAFNDGAAGFIPHDYGF
jgi:hypothetical protein